MEGFKSHMEGKGYSWMFDAEDAEDDDDRRPLMEELEIDPASVPFISFFSFCDFLMVAHVQTRFFGRRAREARCGDT